jgi:hypothetical protein
MNIRALVLLLVPTVVSAQSLEVRLPEPSFTISIPDLPAMDLGPHPNAGRQPTAKLFGSSGGITLSVLTPTADAGTTAAQCASWLAGSVISRFTPDLNKVQLLKAGENAWVVLFPLELAPLTQLKAYVVSGNGKGHCLEVHVSRTQPTEEQRKQWLDGFRNVKVRIE